MIGAVPDGRDVYSSSLETQTPLLPFAPTVGTVFYCMMVPHASKVSSLVAVDRYQAQTRLCCGHYLPYRIVAPPAQRGLFPW